MGNLLASFKTAFPDKAIMLTQREKELPVTTIGLMFTDDKDCEEIEIAKYLMKVNQNFIDTKKEDYLVISKTTPIRVKYVKAGDRLPRNHFPIASWNGENIRVSIPIDSKNLLIEDILVSSLPMLIGEKTDGQDYLTLCKGLSLGITNEKNTLEAQERKNRKEGQSYLDKASSYLTAADRDARIIANLEKMEKEETSKHAKEQWEEITAMIPSALQKAWIQDNAIYVITTPIILLGQFMGSYQIEVTISTGKINIKGITPNVNTEGNPHPHVRQSSQGENVCWGTLNNTYAELRSSKNYVQLIIAALRLLNQYNRDSEFTNLSHWGRRYSGNTSETTKRDCCEDRKGPNYSLAQARKCMSCEINDCYYKANGSKRIFEACYSKTSAKDCVACEHKECIYFQTRFDRCWDVHQKTGPAFCMLRCANEECSHREEALAACTKSNRRTDGTCPASDKCWKPCVKTGE
jgi:hypothetical protein